jgi:flagellar basal-body rod protein FlgB
MDKIRESMQFHSEALQLRAKRQGMLSSNISNADTPGYKSVDVNFAQVLSSVTNSKMPDGVARSQPALAMVGSGGAGNVQTTHQLHLSGKPTDNSAFARSGKFTRNNTASLDGNSVNIERERTAFAENAIKYEASMSALNGSIKRMRDAMSGSN